MVHVTPGATPSARLVMKEFMREKLRRLDESHTNLFIKLKKMEKDLEDLRDRVTLHEGAVMYLNQMLSEWVVYEGDTARLRKAEEEAKKRIDAAGAEPEKVTKRTRKSKKSQSLNP